MKHTPFLPETVELLAGFYAEAAADIRRQGPFTLRAMRTADVLDAKAAHYRAWARDLRQVRGTSRAPAQPTVLERVA